MDIVQHEPPAGRGADFVIRIDLAADGMPGRGEQVWARQVGERRFVLCSLPFFSYGLRADDVVETGESYVVERVAEASGHRLLRLVAVRERADEVHEIVHPLLESLGLDHEYHHPGYVAVDLPAGVEPDRLLDAVRPLIDQGVLHTEFA